MMEACRRCVFNKGGHCTMTDEEGNYDCEELKKEATP